MKVAVPVDVPGWVVFDLDTNKVERFYVDPDEANEQVHVPPIIDDAIVLRDDGWFSLERMTIRPEMRKFLAEVDLPLIEVDDYSYSRVYSKP